MNPILLGMMMAAENGVGGGDGTARYWRFIANDVNWRADAYTYIIAIYELELYETTNATGTNVSPSATISASSQNNATTNAAAKAIDQSNSTHWTSALGNTSYQWLLLDFGAGNEKAIKSLKVSGVNGSPAGLLIAKQSLLQYSDDGSNFTTLATIDTTNAADGVFQTFTDLQ